MKCPICGKGEIRDRVTTETFDFDTGRKVIRVRAENVPNSVCDQCGEEFIGPKGVLIRSRAIRETAAREGVPFLEEKRR